MQSWEDLLPVKLVQDFRKAVEAPDTPVELLAFKDDGYSLTQSASKLYAVQQQIAWLRTYLGPYDKI